MLLPDRILTAATRATAVALGLVTAVAYADDNLTQSATVFQQADLESRRITTLADIATGVPELASTPALDSLSTLSLYMRGEGQIGRAHV